MAYLQGDAIAGCPGRLGRFRGGNRAMTAAEMASLYTAGVSQGDRGASVVPLYESNDISTFTTKANVTITPASSTAPDGSGDAVLVQVTASAATTLSRSVVSLSGHAEFRIYAKQSSGANQANRFALRNNTTALDLISILLNYADGTYTALTLRDGCTIKVVPAAEGFWEITLTAPPAFMSRGATIIGYACFVGAPETAGEAALLWVPRIKSIGQTIDLQPSAIQLVPGQWLEAANSQHLILPDSTRQKQHKTAGQVRGVNTWSASPALQYIGANANILPANAVLTLYAKATVSTTFNIGDQTDVDRYGATVTIGTEFAPVAVLKHGSDGTNRKLTITPTASYTGTVTTMWRVEMVG